jgi:hypothetical protein
MNVRTEWCETNLFLLFGLLLGLAARDLLGRHVLHAVGGFLFGTESTKK